MLETKVEFYNNQRDMKRGIRRMEGQGWSVVSTQAIPQGYGFAKTCCLGILFLPLALLGRKPEKYQVTYQRTKDDQRAAPVVPPAPRKPATPVLSKVHSPKMPVGCLLAAGVVSVFGLIFLYGFWGLAIYLAVIGTPTPVIP